MIYILLVVLLFFLLVGNSEHFGLDLRQSTIKKHTCENIKDVNYDYSKKNFNDTNTINLKYEGEKTKPYSYCKDNVLDYNIRTNYKLNVDKENPKLNKRLLSASDIFYSNDYGYTNNRCPNSLPIFL